MEYSPDAVRKLSLFCTTKTCRSKYAASSHDGEPVIQSRRSPVLARVISLYLVMTSTVLLLAMFHILPVSLLGSAGMPARLNSIWQQSPIYQGAYALNLICDLVGAILLWNLHRTATASFALALIFSIIAMSVFRVAPDTAQGSKFLVGIVGLTIDLALCAYAWWVTSRPSPQSEELMSLPN